MKKIWTVFSAMSRREKITVAILGAVFFLSLWQFVAGSTSFRFRRNPEVFSEGIAGRIQLLNPLFVDFNEVDRDLSELIFSGLVRFDPVQKNFFPDLAESWERSNNSMTYTFALRRNARWHDGAPVTADDVLFTFKDIIQDPGFKNPLLKNAFRDVAIEKNGTSTVVFTLPKPNSFFITSLTTGLLPKHALPNIPIATLEKASFNSNPIGSGPYRVASLKLDSDGDRIELAAFNDYYGKKPLLERMRIYTFPDEKTLVKERPALYAISKLNGATAKNIKKEDSRFEIYPYTLNQFTALYFNTNHQFLKEKRIRQALGRALDKNALLSGSEQRIDTLDSRNYQDKPEFKTNFADAEKLLDNLGFRMKEDGFRVNTKGNKLSLTLLAFSKIPMELVAGIRDQWKKIGVNVEIQQAEGEEFIRLTRERRYSALLIRQNLGYNRDVYPLFHSSQSGSLEGESGQNFANFKSFRTDGLTEAIRKERDPKAKEKLLGELSKVIAEEVPVIFLSTPVYYYAIDKKMKAFPAQSLDFHSDRFRIIPYLTFVSKP